MMTINQLYKKGKDYLTDAGIEDPDFDSRCLLEYVLNCDTAHYFMIRNDVAEEKHISLYTDLLKRRASGEPLQYILGKWEFMSNEFYVGTGVLIPRPETEKLVELAKEFLSDRKTPIVIDLCSGSGCIAISLAKLIPDATVYAVEKYVEAYRYLQRNISLNGVNNVIAVQGDLFDSNILSDVSADLILSNPPYIRKADISTLSVEVHAEPVTALDGGVDGYDFYRFLSEYWLKDFLKDGSAMMVECAEDQGDYISELFEKNSLHTKIIYDFNGLQRIVAAYK